MTRHVHIHPDGKIVIYGWDSSFKSHYAEVWGSEVHHDSGVDPFLDTTTDNYAEVFTPDDLWKLLEMCSVTEGMRRNAFIKKLSQDEDKGE